MAALTSARNTDTRNLGPTRFYLMADSTQIWAGSMVMINSAGLAVPAAAAAGNLGVVGLAKESKLSDTSGAIWIEVQECEALFVGTTMAQTAVNVAVYAEDDQTVDETQGANEPLAGYCSEFVSATSVWVRLGML